MSYLLRPYPYLFATVFQTNRKKCLALNKFQYFSGASKHNTYQYGTRPEGKKVEKIKITRRGAEGKAGDGKYVHFVQFLRI